MGLVDARRRHHDSQSNYNTLLYSIRCENDECTIIIKFQIGQFTRSNWLTQINSRPMRGAEINTKRTHATSNAETFANIK